MSTALDHAIQFRTSMRLASSALAGIALDGGSAIVAHGAVGTACGYDVTAADDFARLRKHLDEAEIALAAMNQKAAA